MSLKNRIFIDKFAIPIILLVLLIIYIIKQGKFGFIYFLGFYIFFFIMWIIFSSIYIFSQRNNHLIEYTINKDTIEFLIQKNLNSKKEIEVPINSIKNTTEHTRFFSFGFDSLDIKYIDEEDLYNLLSIRIPERKDWITLLSVIDNHKEK